jgi:hypothetical protein
MIAFLILASPFMDGTDGHISLLAEMADVSCTRNLQTFRRSAAEQRSVCFVLEPTADSEIAYDARPATDLKCPNSSRRDAMAFTLVLPRTQP